MYVLQEALEHQDFQEALVDLEPWDHLVPQDKMDFLDKQEAQDLWVCM